MVWGKPGDEGVRSGIYVLGWGESPVVGPSPGNLNQWGPKPMGKTLTRTKTHKSKANPFTMSFLFEKSLPLNIPVWNNLYSTLGLIWYTHHKFEWTLVKVNPYKGSIFAKREILGLSIYHVLVGCGQHFNCTFYWGYICIRLFHKIHSDCSKM